MFRPRSRPSAFRMVKVKDGAPVGYMEFGESASPLVCVPVKELESERGVLVAGVSVPASASTNDRGAATCIGEKTGENGNGGMSGSPSAITLVSPEKSPKDGAADDS
mmetsp:Transcript_47943/g.126974  ORF Transcript_47943/g.126974 Transcript_47943/m.126974 type:complete len:107 (-) Transcript_47943:453-773(-)